MSVVRIVSDGSPSGTSVYVGDLEIDGLQGVDFHIGTGIQSTVTLVIVGARVDFTLPPIPAEGIRVTRDETVEEGRRRRASVLGPIEYHEASGARGGPPPFGEDPIPVVTEHTSTLAELFAPVGSRGPMPDVVPIPAREVPF